MTRYLEKSFSVNMAGGKSYRDNWDAIFAKNEEPDTLPELPDSVDLHEMVQQFHRAFGQPVNHKPTKMDLATVKLRLRLVAEEFFELLECFDDKEYGSGSRYCAAEHVKDFIDCLRRADYSEAQVADATTDLKYVTEGLDLVAGIPSRAVLREVHRSNMSKLGPDGKPMYREDGKVIKGPSYSPPDLNRVIWGDE